MKEMTGSLSSLHTLLLYLASLACVLIDRRSRCLLKTTYPPFFGFLRFPSLPFNRFPFVLISIDRPFITISSFLLLLYSSPVFPSFDRQYSWLSIFLPFPPLSRSLFFASFPIDRRISVFLSTTHAPFSFGLLPFH